MHALGLVICSYLLAISYESFWSAVLVACVAAAILSAKTAQVACVAFAVAVEAWDLLFGCDKIFVFTIAIIGTLLWYLVPAGQKQSKAQQPADHREPSRLRPRRTSIGGSKSQASPYVNSSDLMDYQALTISRGGLQTSQVSSAKSVSARRRTSDAAEAKARPTIHKIPSRPVSLFSNIYRRSVIRTSTPGSYRERQRGVGVPPGLRNFSQTCFVNAVLQSLAVLPPILNWVNACETQVEARHPIDAAPQHAQGLAWLLQALHLNTRTDVPAPPANALSEHSANDIDVRLGSWLTSISDATQGLIACDPSWQRQQDAQALLQWMFQLSRANDASRPSPTEAADPPLPLLLGGNFQHSWVHIDRCLDCHCVNVPWPPVEDTALRLTVLTTPPTTQEAGQPPPAPTAASVTASHPQYCSRSQPSHVVRSLSGPDSPLHPNQPAVAVLGDLVRAELMNEILGVQCQGCSSGAGNTTRERTTVLVNAGPCLMVQLKRWTYDASFRVVKNRVCVDIEPDAPLVLPVVARREAETREEHKQRIQAAAEADNFEVVSMRLAAVICHEGSLSVESGHYVAYVRRGEQWALANDKLTSAVSSVEVRRRCMQDAYVLLYCSVAGDLSGGEG